MALFNAKAIHLKEHHWYYLTLSWEDNGLHTFSKGICPRVNEMDFELSYYGSVVLNCNHYTTRTSSLTNDWSQIGKKIQYEKNVKDD